MRYLMPLAARDTLFPRDEFHFPKPLVEIDGEPMIEHVVASIRRHDTDAEFIFVVLEDDCRTFSLDKVLELATDGRCKVIQLKEPTRGAACTALMAIEHINDDHPLVISNSDQIIDLDVDHVIRSFHDEGIDAGVITFPSVHPRWSYVRVHADGRIAEAAEKSVISRHAIAGFYYFRHGSAFVRAAQASIRKRCSVAGNYYIAPTLNEFILDGAGTQIHEIPAERYVSFYSPQRLTQYLRDRGFRRSGSSADAAPRLAVAIPMAGLGSRFAKEGYSKPKPFIDVAGMTMIERVMENLRIPAAHFVLISRYGHLEAVPAIVEALKARGDVSFCPIDFTTEGAACTVLFARDQIDRDAPLLIANCDQIVDFDCADFIRDAHTRGLDGSILVFRDPKRDPKWSFARTGTNGLVREVQEKKPISDLATVGLYFFTKAGTFIDAALDMIVRNERVNNEFYVCPVYNYCIRQGRRIGIFEIPADAMHGIGTPEDLDLYLRTMKP